jgi:hypothetical protein
LRFGWEMVGGFVPFCLAPISFVVWTALSLVRQCSRSGAVGQQVGRGRIHLDVVISATFSSRNLLSGRLT